MSAEIYLAFLQFLSESYPCPLLDFEFVHYSGYNDSNIDYVKLDINNSKVDGTSVTVKFTKDNSLEAIKEIGYIRYKHTFDFSLI